MSAAREPQQRSEAPPMGADAGAAWMVHMRRGEFAKAWEVADAVLQGRAGVPCWHLPRHEQYVWDGTPLANRRVLVRCYHGLGDTIHFIRYAALVKQLGASVIVWAQPVLIPLLRTVAGIDGLLPLHDGAPDVDHDVSVEVMELPHVFRTTLETIPAAVPYVHVPGASARTRTPGQPLRVGIVWQSGDWDERRSIRTSQLAPLAGVPDVEFHSLQLGAAGGEWPGRWGRASATDDVFELARRMCTLDLVVSVDSFPAHLAGALAIPTWTLLHADADWRWMLDRDDSPWYPGMRLWRQATPGDWDAVIARVAAQLARCAPTELHHAT